VRACDGHSCDNGQPVREWNLVVRGKFEYRLGISETKPASRKAQKSTYLSLDRPIVTSRSTRSPHRIEPCENAVNDGDDRVGGRSQLRQWAPKRQEAAVFLS
jgi:hypothetical protein